ncbi:MAG: LIC12162 family transferase [Alphaproteobacteria bacterium]
MADAADTRPGTLYLSRIDNDFDAETDIALDPWCFVGREDIYPDWQRLAFVDPFPRLQDVEAAHEKIRPWLAHLVKTLTVDLNRMHGTEYSQDFWRIMVMTWLSELTQRVWKHYVLIERLIDDAGDRAMRATVWTDPVSWPFSTIDQFYQCLLQGREFNWWIDSHLLKVMAPAHWTLIPATDTPDPDGLVGQRDVRTEPKGFGRLIRWIKLSLGYTDIVGTKWRGVALSMFANLLPGHRSRHRIQPDTNFVPEDVFPAAFLEVFEKIMKATMPRAYGEQFAEYSKAARTYPTRPGRLRLGTLSFWNDEEKFIAAFGHEAGEKLIQCQHGGGYGIAAIHLKPAEIEYRNDAFLSWGWTGHGDYEGRIIPLPSPLLSKMADSHRETVAELIVVGDAPRVRKSRIDQRPRAVDYFRCVPDSVRLLAGLQDRVRARAWFRPYLRAAVDIDVMAGINERFPDVPVLTGDLHGRLLGCRLTVLQGLGTTMNIVMAANVPTVCVWDREFFKVCPQAQPYFDGLEECGILFHDETTAARHINDIWDDVDGWWQSDKVQTARRSWRDNFARTDGLWWWQWMKALTKLSRER